MSVTMADIARAAKVSRPTVSLVLNNLDHSGTVKISPKTRDRVIALAGEMGYCRNEMARAIKIGHSNVIGVAGWMGNSFSAHILSGISDMARRHDWALKLIHYNPNDNGGDFRDVVRICVSQRLGGLILIDPVLHANTEMLGAALERHPMPMVIVDDSGTDGNRRYERGGIRAALRHLHGLGHRRIALIKDHGEAGHSRNRTQAFHDERRALDVPPPPEDIALLGSMRIEPGEMERIATLFGTCTACFAVSDYLALKVLSAAHALGRRVPEELSVVGFGDLEFAALAAPTLTTVRQQFQDTGAKAAEVLLRKIKARDMVAEPVELPVELIVRRSTGPAPERVPGD